MPTWTPATKATATHTPQSKSAAPTWGYEIEPGAAQAYNQAGVTYNQANVRYNSLKPVTTWANQNES